MVLASGLWTSELARLAGADVALFPAEHVWVMTDETDLASETKPFVRDLDGFLYVRHYRGRLVIGAFEPDGRPLPPARVPVTGFVELGPDWDHFAPVLAQARRRIPGLESLGFEHFLRAPESFTPDGNLQLGLVPEVPGLFVAAGLNSQGIIFGPGVGRAAAEWILAGHPTMDLVEVDVARTGSWATQRRWLQERTVESLGSLYDMHWPAKQPTTARGLRRLPLHAEHRAAGAAFGQAAGWERPLWFEPGVLEPRDPLRLRRPVVVRRRPRGGRRDPHRRRPVRPDDLLEVPRPGPGQRRRAPAPRDVRPRRRRRPRRLHRPRQRARRDRDGPDDHAPRRVHLPRPGADAEPAAHAGPAAQRAAGRRGRDRRHLCASRRSTSRVLDRARSWRA